MEKSIHFQVRDRYLSGVLLTPEKAKACVVLASGFLISMNGPRGVFVALSERLYKMGYAVLRFSYSDSAGRKIREPLLEKNLEELKAAIDFAKASFGRVYLLGYSFSGTLALLLTETFRSVEKMILWAPFLGFKLAAQRDWKKLRKLRRVHRLGYWTMIKLLLYYVMQKGKVNLQVLVRMLNIPMLVVHGDRDQICDFSRVPELFQKKNVKVKLLKDADHFFAGHEQAVVNVTATWLQDHEEGRVRVL